MARVTDALLAEFQERVNRGEHINSTVGEEAQLLHAFREYRRLVAALAARGNSIEFWRYGDYYKLVDGQLQHATEADADGFVDRKPK